MAKSTMNKAFLASAVLALALTGCQRRAAETPPLAGAAIGGPFALTDQDGHPFASSRLAGRYPVIYFGYTSCPDACPTAMQVLAKGIRTLAARDPVKAAKVQPVFISVDPARDTPPVLKQFVRAFSPTLIGLTGSEQAIAGAAKEYAVYYKKEPPAKGTTGYLMQHQTVPILFGPDGKPMALVPVDADDKAVADTLARWVS